jgi:hypothetical protein
MKPIFASRYFDFLSTPEGLRCGLENDSVEELLVFQGQGFQAFRKRKDYIKMPGRQDIPFPCLKPFAVGAMVISAGVVGYPHGTTFMGLPNMATQGCSEAGLDALLDAVETS